MLGMGQATNGWLSRTIGERQLVRDKSQRTVAKYKETSTGGLAANVPVNYVECPARETAAENHARTQFANKKQPLRPGAVCLLANLVGTGSRL